MAFKRFVGVVTLILSLTSFAQAQTGVLKNTTIDVDEETSVIRLDGIQSLGISVVNSGTYELRFEASADGGVTYVAVGAVDVSDFTRDSSTTGAGTWLFGNQGFTHFRVRAESYSSGAPVVKFARGYGSVTAPLSAGSVSGANDAAGATGAAVPSSASYTGIRVGANLVGQTGFTVGSSNGAAVAIIDGSGNQITSFGGGTQYTETDTDASISGTAMLMEGAANALVPAQGTAADGLLVNLGANNDVTVTNAGTFATQAAQSGTWNVTNVSGTVSLPTGASTAANQSTAITALQLIDNIPITIGSTTSGQSGALAMGAVTTSAPTYTTAQSHPLSLDTTGSLRVAITSGAGSGGTALADDADFTAGTTSFTPFGGFYQSTVTACTDGDTCAAGITTGRALKVHITDAAGASTTLASDATVGTAVPTTAPLSLGEYKEFDGSALPTTTNVNTEGEAATIATTLQGVQYVMVVSEDGSLERGTSTTPMVVGDGSGALNTIIDSGTVTTVSTVTSVSQLGGSAVPVEDAAETAGGTGIYAMSVRRDTAASSAGTAGDNATVNTDSLGRLWVRAGNPCEDHARVQSAAISNSTSGNVEVVALNGSDLIYVCGYSLVAGAATGVRFVYGTGTACATGETGLTGAWSFAANGGISQPNGGAPQFVVPAGNAFCTENTGANAIAGHVTYVRTAAP